MFSLTKSPIHPDPLQNEKAGALVVFEGWVRDHNQGRRVNSLEYQVYEELAQKEGEKILREAKEKYNVHAVECVHRFGHLKLGEAAVWVGATATHRDDAFKAARYVIDEIKHRLPIWKKEHYTEGGHEWVSCRDHHTHVHFEPEDYYRKQARLVFQSKLAQARVLVVGAGGLGCPVLTSLAAAGVGTIHVADHDVIDITNIHRQFLYSPVLVGEKKALVARQKLAEMNPFIYVEAHDVFVHAGNVEALLEGIHLVLDCTDNMRTKFLLHDACFLHRIPLVSASVYKYVGQVRSFDPATGLGCLRCSTAETPSDSLIGNCNDFGVLGASVGVVGNIQAGEAIAFLLNRTNATLSETLYLDLKALTQMKVRNGKREGCASCSGNLPLERDDFEIDSDILNDDFEIVDIRTVSEDMLSQYVTSSRKVAVLCDRGIRSLRAVKALRAKGHSHFFSVRGGASAVLK